MDGGRLVLPIAAVDGSWSAMMPVHSKLCWRAETGSRDGTHELGDAGRYVIYVSSYVTPCFILLL